MLIIFYRTLILYFFITFILRFTGKRQLGELSPSEMVTTVLISNLAAFPIENEERSLICGIIPIAVIACLEVILSYISLKIPLARRILNGKERLIIKNGRLDEAMMEKLRISVDDLEEELRGKGIFDINEVEEAVVETGGSLSVLLKMPFRSLKNSPAKSLSRSYAVLKDGRISNEALADLGINENFIISKLAEFHLKPENVFLMTLDGRGKIFIERKRK